MSAKHCVITCETIPNADDPDAPPEYKVTIEDHSRHGVLVNKTKIEEKKPHVLRDDDVVTLPFGMDYTFRLREDGAKPITPPPVEPKSARKKTPGGQKRAASGAGKPSAAKKTARGASSPEDDINTAW